MANKLNVQVVVGLVDRLSRPLQGLRGKVKREIDALDRTLQRTANLTLVGDAFNQAAQNILNPVKEMVRQAADFESSVANVQKVLEGLETPEALRQYREELMAMSEAMPYTRDQLAAIDDQGARMGKTLGQLAAFRKLTAMQALAFDMPPEQAAEQMGVMGNLYKWTDAQATRFADTLSALDNAMITNERKLLEIVNRTQSVSKGFGLVDAEAAALAASFSSVGLSEERASTAMNNLLNNLLTARAGTKDFAAGLQSIGLSAKSVEAGIKAGPQAFLQDFFARIAKLDNISRAVTLTGLFGKESQDEIGAMAGAADLYAKAVEVINGADVDGTMARAFELQLGTFNNQLLMLNNTLSNVQAQGGTELLGTLKELVGEIKPMVRGLRDWAKENPDLTRNILLTAGAIGVLLTVVAGLVVPLAGLVGALALLKWGLMAIGGGSVLGIIVKGFALLFGALKPLWKLLLMPVGTLWKGFLAGAKLVVPVLKLVLVAARILGTYLWVSLARGAIPAVVKALGLLRLAMLANPIAWIVGLIAGAIYVFTHWEETIAAASQAWEWLIEKLGFDPFAVVQQKWQALSDYLMLWAAGTKELLTEAWDWVKEKLVWDPMTVIPANWDAMKTYFKDLFAGIVFDASMLIEKFAKLGPDMVAGFKRGFDTGWAGVTGWLYDKTNGLIGTARDGVDANSPSRAFMQIGADIMRGLEVGIRASERLPLAAMRNAAGALTLGASVAAMPAAAMPALAWPVPQIDTSAMEAKLDRLTLPDSIRWSDARPVAEPDQGQPTQARAPRSASISISMPITINATAGTDTQALAALVRREVQGATKAAAGRIAALYDSTDDL